MWRAINEVGGNEEERSDAQESVQRSQDETSERRLRSEFAIADATAEEGNV